MLDLSSSEKKILTLDRRLAFLRSKDPNSFDRAEESALSWALPILRDTQAHLKYILSWEKKKSSCVKL